MLYDVNNNGITIREEKRIEEKRIYISLNKLSSYKIAPCSGAKIKKTMAKKNFKIRAKFVFDGQVIIRANNRQEAEAAAEKYIAAQLGNVQPLDECVQDWDFSMKSSTVVNRKREEAGL